MSLKIIEVLVLLIAGVLFVVWQWRDLQKAREITRLQDEERSRTQAATAPAERAQRDTQLQGAEKGPDGG